MNSNEQDASEIFREEASELLAVIEESLLELEVNPEESESLNQVFRAFHTIKGSGAMFGFDRISEFSHKVENVLDKVRKGKVSVTKQLIDLILVSRDFLQEMFNETEGRGKADQEKELLILEGLEVIASGETFKQEAPPEPKPEEKGAQTIFAIRFVPEAGIFSRCLDPLNIIRELSELGEVSVKLFVDRIPLLKELQVDRCYLEYDMLLTTDKDENAIRDVFMFVEDDSEIEIREVANEETARFEDAQYKKLGEILTEREDVSQKQLDQVLQTQEKAKNKTGDLLIKSGLITQEKVSAALAEQQIVRRLRQKKQANTVRVSAERLDFLINIVGELVTTQARLMETAKNSENQELMRTVEDMERLSTDLRDSVLSIRMMPIQNTFNKFKRLVRDLSQNLDKKVYMELKGGETELDKTVIEKIDEPLVHLVRNAVDHGIEFSEKRAELGKSKTGYITLSAAHVGGSVLITIRDDGRGVDAEAIYKKALDAGLVNEQDNLSYEEKLHLIFHPGLSTAEKVSDVSGRGVGMDVVKSQIARLHGSVNIESRPGEGTKVIIKLPLTLAIIDGLLVESYHDKYIIPLSNIKECVEVSDRDIEHAHGCDVIRVRDELIPYIRLRDFFFGQEREQKIEQMVVVEYDNTWAGIVIDHIYGDHQTVIKSLGRNFAYAEGVSGATILGDGNVALIIDVPKLIERAIMEESDSVTHQ